ncbi:MCE family protein [Mycolicibacterium aichiense]|uniref:Mammalian cell entry protein n=1 Tax=Mycolicibacterium aichiense TaxID=1799 RepID=A0AAD1MFX0_9MYCO|nr:MlaD family protein [Mycolicibacterium aichiense]MCV7016953.1 MCE family protein [Mycolicibacterium aichiense]BBX10624.1 mammalian cell entry protein [Mycolicibacterium aichiense]STZ25720.1 mce family protein [Mycolicibacterium aichiense]
MLTRFIKTQLVMFGVLTVIALLVLGWYFLRLPTLAGIGQYELKANLPSSGGLYTTANVTYRGITIGRVTDVEPTETGVRATMSISDKYKIPADATANVHSVSAVGEQYLDLVSDGNPGQYFSPGQTITKSTVPEEIGPALDAANKGLAALPADKIPMLLNETAQAVGGLGPALQRLVDGTQAIVTDFKTNIQDVNDIIQNSAPVVDSQVNSSDAIQRWAANLDTITTQTAQQDQALRNGLSQAAPTADAVNAVFSDVQEALPQTLANLEIVLDMLKRYHKGVEQSLVLLPQGASVAQSVSAPYPRQAALDFGLTINQPPPCLTGFLPASQWRAPADLRPMPVENNLYCKIPKDTPANVVRGARNFPCADVPGKRAATPMECRSTEPYTPLGNNPWYGDPNQVLNCPAPGARCDQPVNPGTVIPAPSINNGMNPLPADLLPGPTPPTSDPLTPPGTGTVQCNGQQPNPCTYTPAAGSPAPGNTAVYTPQNGELTGPDGVKYDVKNSSSTGDDGWKEMLAPAG